jgi:hypothetical protein
VLTAPCSERPLGTKAASRQYPPDQGKHRSCARVGTRCYGPPPWPNRQRRQGPDIENGSDGQDEPVSDDRSLLAVFHRGVHKLWTPFHIDLHDRNLAGELIVW